VPQAHNLDHFLVCRWLLPQHLDEMPAGFTVENDADQLRRRRWQAADHAAQHGPAMFVRHGHQYPGQYSALRPTLALFDEPEVRRELASQRWHALGAHIDFDRPRALEFSSADHGVSIRLHPLALVVLPPAARLGLEAD